MSRILPEKIKPGLNVLVDWNGHMEKGKVLIKLRKNWLVYIRDRDCSSAGGVNGRYSVPPHKLYLDVGITKDGRMLMANQKDKAYLFSKEHIDYINDLTEKEGLHTN